MAITGDPEVLRLNYSPSADYLRAPRSYCLSCFSQKRALLHVGLCPGGVSATVQGRWSPQPVQNVEPGFSLEMNSAAQSSGTAEKEPAAIDSSCSSTAYDSPYSILVPVHSV